MGPWGEVFLAAGADWGEMNRKVEAVKTPVLVVGGGAAGCAASLSLAQRGLASLMVEREPRLGGKAGLFCCKAAEVCAKCGACRVGDLLEGVRVRHEVSLFTRALPVKAENDGNTWRVELAPQAGVELTQPGGGDWPTLPDKLTVECGAVVLAVGHTPFEAQTKTRFGMGRVPGVISASQLEERLAEDAMVIYPEKMAFIQCVGSRDQAIGRLYCSRVCCGFALRMARLIKSRNFATQITFFHMDVQGYGRSWEDELTAMRAEMDFIPAMPGEVRRGPAGPQVCYAEPGGGQARADFDLVVLSNGLAPPAGAARLQELFGLGLTPDGFLGDAESAGVFAAGSAAGPRSIVESIEHGALAAAKAAAYLREETHA